MPELNEQRVVKRRAIFPFTYEKGWVSWFSTYYAVEEWYNPYDDGWGWHLVGIATKETYQAFIEDKKNGVFNHYKYSRV